MHLTSHEGKRWSPQKTTNQNSGSTNAEPSYTKNWTPENIITAICRVVVAKGPFNLAWYGKQSDKNAIVVPIHIFPEDIRLHEMETFEISSVPDSPAAFAWNHSRIFVVNQIQSDMNFPKWQSMAIRYGYESVVAIPIISRPHPKGIFVLYAPTTNPIDRELLTDLDELSTLLSRTLAVLAEKAIQKKTIVALTKQEEMYHSVFENTGTGTIIIDYDMTIMHANAKFLSMVGYSRDEVEKKMKWSQFVAPQDNERMQRYHFGRRRKEPGIPTDYQCRIIDRNGRLKYIDMQVGVIPDSMHSIASFMDITKRKLAEDQLKESESRLSAIIETFDGLIYISDRAYKILFMNKTLSERAGSSAQTSYCYRMIHGLDKPCEWCNQPEVLSGSTVKKEIKSPL